MRIRDKISIIVFTILLFSCQLLIQVPPDFKEYNGSIIVTVDGLSVINSLEGSEGSTNPPASYLANSLAEKITNPEIEVYPFNWSGDASGDTALLLSEDQNETNLRYFLRQKYIQAKNELKNFIVIGHSWGSVLTYYALALEGIEDDPLECTLYLSLSSPLGSEYASVVNYPEEIIISQYIETALAPLNLSQQQALYPKAKIFYNYWAWGDVVSGPLDELVQKAAGIPGKVIDIRFDKEIFSLPGGLLDILGAYENRDMSNCTFWHKFSSLDDSVVQDAEYADKKGINNPGELYTSFIKEILFLLL